MRHMAPSQVHSRKNWNPYLLDEQDLGTTFENFEELRAEIQEE